MDNFTINRITLQSCSLSCIFLQRFIYHYTKLPETGFFFSGLLIIVLLKTFRNSHSTCLLEQGHWNVMEVWNRILYCAFSRAERFSSTFALIILTLGWCTWLKMYLLHLTWKGNALNEFIQKSLIHTNSFHNIANQPKYVCFLKTVLLFLP